MATQTRPVRSTKTTNKNKVSKSSMVKTRRFNVKRNYLIIFAVFAAIGIGAIIRSFAATPYWTPTADKPLTLGWILEGTVNPANLASMQTKDLNGKTIPTADVYDIDGEYNSKAVVDALHAQGKKVICYIDAGVFEDYRSDASKFPASVKGKADDGWEGSYWLDIRQIDVLKPIMQARLQMCKDKGFDSVEPDEMVNYTNDSGFPLTYNDQLKYNKAVASWAHAIGISIGLKDDHEQAHDLVGDFDWMLDEECWAYNECLRIDDTGKGGPSGTFDSVIAFTKANKAAWVAEYPDGDNGNGQDYPASERDKSQASHLTASKTKSICDSSIANRINTAFYITGLPSNGGRTDCPQFPARGETTPTPPVIVNPTVSITRSPSTSLVAPASLTVTGTSSLAGTIEITQDGSVKKTCTAVTTCAVAFSNYQAGTYNFNAKATTADGGVGTSSQSVTIASAPTTPPANKVPTVSISGPSGALTEPAQYSLSVNASDPDGTVSKVVLLVNGVSTGTESKVAPFTFNFAQKPAGTYTYNVIATDNSGATSAVSNTVTVTVNAATPATGSAPAPVTINNQVDIAFNFFTTCTPQNNCRMTIYWKPSTLATSYVVKRSDGTVLTTTANNFFVEQPATTGKTYTYQVFAKNNVGLSAGSNVFSKSISCSWFICY